MKRSAEQLAERKEARRVAKLPSIAHNVTVHEDDTDEISVRIDGVLIRGQVKYFNRIIEQLGFRPVRLTSNMLNKDSRTFAIDIDTPPYCDPGCESYHSM